MKSKKNVMEKTMERTQVNGGNTIIANFALGAIPFDASVQHESQQKFEPVSEGFQLQYKHPNGCLYQGNSVDWLESLDDASVDLVFADPPYNIKKAEWDNFDNQEKYIEWSIKWIVQASRVIVDPIGETVIRLF
jgi:16S rRNA G966 N2-methylase RsmD